MLKQACLLQADSGWYNQNKNITRNFRKLVNLKKAIELYSLENRLIKLKKVLEF